MVQGPEEGQLNNRETGRERGEAGMGSLFSRVLDALSGKTEKRILMLGQ